MAPRTFDGSRPPQQRVEAAAQAVAVREEAALVAARQVVVPLATAPVATASAAAAAAAAATHSVGRWAARRAAQPVTLVVAREQFPQPPAMAVAASLWRAVRRQRQQQKPQPQAAERPLKLLRRPRPAEAAVVEHGQL